MTTIFDDLISGVSHFQVIADSVGVSLMLKDS